MRNTFEGAEQGTGPSAEQREKMMDTIREIDSGAQGSFDTYITMSFTDSQGRWVEARFLQSHDAPFTVTLNANTGSPLALLELERKFREKAVKIQKMVAIHATQDEARALREAVADIA